MTSEKENSSKETGDLRPTFESTLDKQPTKNQLKRQKWRIVFVAPSIKKELIPLKIVLFCWYGAFSSLLPYLTIYMKQLGVKANEIAFIYTFFPVAKLLGPAVGGLIADKLGRYKPVLSVALAANIFFATAFLFIPSIPSPNCKSTTDLICQSSQKPHVTFENCCKGEPCQTLNRSVELEITSCNKTCHESNTSSNFVSGSSICFHTDYGKRFCVSVKGTDDELNNQSDKLNVSINSEWKNESCSYIVESIHNNNETLPIISCLMENITEDCYASCSLKTLDTNEENCKIAWNDRFKTLAIAFIIFMGFQVFVAICFSLVEATTLAMVKEHKDDYGRQRVWAILATAIFSPLTGFLVDISSSHKGHTDYSPAFYVFDVLMICNIAFIYILNLPILPPAKQILKNMKELILMPEVVAFLIVIFFLGTFWGFLESFLFWHLLDLGSPKYLLGLTLTVGAIVGLPFLYTSDVFVKKFGRVNLLIVAFLFYAIRCIGYSYIYNPWWFVLFEAMEASTYHLMWVAAATYASSLAPKGLLATIQGWVAGIHFGIGRGSGSLIGGNLISKFQNRIAFRSMGIAAAILGAIYAILYYSLLRNLKSNKTQNDTTVPVEDLPKTESKDNKISSSNEERF